MEWLHMTAKEYRETIRTRGKAQPARVVGKMQAKSLSCPATGTKSSNKYNAQKTVINGVQFDSRKEGIRSAALEQMLSAGKISGLKRQVRFILQEGYINNQGQKVRPIYYIADFMYFDNEKQCWVVEDVKGSKATLTEVYKIKKKMFGYKYPEYIFVEFI